MHFFFSFCTLTNKCTIISQIITVLHVSTLSRHSQGACNQCHAKLHKYFKFKSAGASVQSTAGCRGARISGSNAGYTMFRGSVKSTGYPLHSPGSPSLPLPCVTVCHHISTGVYYTSLQYTTRLPSTRFHLFLGATYVTLILTSRQQ